MSQEPRSLNEIVLESSSTSTMTLKSGCQTCTHWVRGKSYFDPLKFTETLGSQGECRRFPPVIVGSSSIFNPINMGKNGIFPVTTFDTYCGEHKEIT